MIKPEKIVIQYDGRPYTWNGKGWYGSDYAAPPKVVVDKLNALIAKQLAEKDQELDDADELIKRAKDAQKTGQKNRALDLARRAYQLQPEAGIAAVLCSFLRDGNKSEEALDIANQFLGVGYSPILTSRAAALCDLERWEEALKQIKQVLAICQNTGKNAGEALSVHLRIKANAPHLLK